MIAVYVCVTLAGQDLDVTVPLQLILVCHQMMNSALVKGSAIVDSASATPSFMEHFAKVVKDLMSSRIRFVSTSTPV